MSDIKLTKDASFLLKAIYKAYKIRIRDGLSRSEASILGSSSDIQQEIVSAWSLENINDACWELHNAGLLNCMSGDDSIEMAILTPEGIIHEENRFNGTLKSVWNLLRELIPFIPSG